MAETPQDALTTIEYRAFEQAYHWLSATVFVNVLGHPLPPCLITLQRRRGTYGYFAHDRFAPRRDGLRTTHEIALNPDLFPDRSDKEILSTLAHEGVHAYQQHYGRPGRRGYHNAEWAWMMECIGLIPSTTGEAGGKKTGQCVSHYIRSGGPFDHAIETILTTGFSIRWQSALPPESRSQGNNTALVRSLQSKSRFTCPRCAQNAWAKPTAQLVCGVCGQRMRA